MYITIKTKQTGWDTQKNHPQLILFY